MDLPTTRSIDQPIDQAMHGGRWLIPCPSINPSINWTNTSNQSINQHASGGFVIVWLLFDQPVTSILPREPTNQSIHLLTNQSIDRSISHPITQPIDQSTRLEIKLPSVWCDYDGDPFGCCCYTIIIINVSHNGGHNLAIDQSTNQPFNKQDSVGLWLKKQSINQRQFTISQAFAGTIMIGLW